MKCLEYLHSRTSSIIYNIYSGDIMRRINTKEKELILTRSGDILEVLQDLERGRYKECRIKLDDRFPKWREVEKYNPNEHEATSYLFKKVLDTTSISGTDRPNM